MAAPTQIVGRNTRAAAEVTDFGQLVVAPLNFSTPLSTRIASPGVAINLIEPKNRNSIVITDIILSTSRTVGVNGANILIYEAATANTLTSLDDILETEIVKNFIVPISGLNLGVPQGRFVNITTNDVDVFVAIMFYRIKGQIKK